VANVLGLIRRDVVVWEIVLEIEHGRYMGSAPLREKVSGGLRVSAQGIDENCGWLGDRPQFSFRGAATGSGLWPAR
jgi:hypothetical protein